MIKLNSLLSKSKHKNDEIEEDILVELNMEDADKVMAVGNSVQSGKWYLNEDMKYSISKKMY